MGRRESELDPNAGPVERFAFELRTLRREAGTPTYKVLAERAGYSVTALSQAAAGERLPTLPVALAYVRACGGDVEEWERRWRDTAREAARLRDDDEARPPYRGLARFEPDDAALFFGRDRLVEKLTDLTRRHRFTAVFGPSGSGKSSLLRAGLIPRLRQGGDGGPRPATVRIITPGADPLAVHGDRLAPRLDVDGDTWLIVDQFEELYTLCHDPAVRAAFLDRLLAARDADSRLRVVVAVRADFLGRCAEHAGLIAAVQDATLLVGPMSRDELREAVVKPAAAVGLQVERSLTSRLLDEAENEPGALPLLSHALLETWQHRRGRALTREAYDAAGGLHGAAARTAEEVFARLTDAQADLARRILLRLVAPGDGTPDTRRPADRAELDLGDPRDTATVLEHLARARLITLADGTVDLAHEALIDAWPRLRGWIDAERDRLRLHRRLTEAARGWEDLGRDPGALYRGSRLVMAGEAFPEPDRHRDLTPVEQEFLAASVRQRRRSVALRRAVTAVLAILLLLTSGTAVVAFQQRATARTERNTAIFHQITAKADELRGARSSLAAQLDLAAYRMRRTPELRTKLVSGAHATLSTPLTGHTGVVTSVVFAPDGKTLVSTGYDAAVRLWHIGDRARPRPLGRLPGGHEGPVLSAVFAPGGNTLVTTGFDRTVRLWDVTDPKEPEPLGGPLTGHEGPVVSAAFDPAGRVLVTAGDDAAIRVWDVADPREPDLLDVVPDAHGRSVRSVAFAPDGKTLASGGYDKTVRLWDVADPARLRALGEPLEGHEAAVWSVEFAPDGKTLAGGGYDATVRLWDVGDPKEPEPLGEPLEAHDAAVTSVAFAPDGKTLVTTGQDDTLRLWNVANPAYPMPLGEPLTDHTDGVWTVAFGPDGTTLASGGQDHVVRLWHRPATLLTGHTNPVNSVAFDPDGRLLASASSHDHMVRLWNTRDPARPSLIGEPLIAHEGPVTSVAFAPRGNVLASASEDRTVRLWDVGDPARPRALGDPLEGRVGIVHAVAFDPDGRLLAAAGADGGVRLWDVADPARPRVLGDPLDAHGNDVASLAFDPRGNVLATAGADNTVRLWDVADPARPRALGEPLTGHLGIVHAVAFSPDGRVLAGASEDRTVRLWNVADPARPRALGDPLTGYKGPVHAVAFGPDGATLAGAGSDNTVRLWDVADPARPTPLGEPLTGHVDTITSVAFAPDGDTLASGGYDVTARVWQLDAERAIRRICSTTAGSLTRRQWERYVPQVPFTPPCG
ncbi:WD40 repeat domain-containing protein [Streptomyces macrosporus]|uniref:HTH cro/C1-type domain-containing protein n=1 Tax=Streptomyces macrosporus TaxID=44032 RepID=A0ABP5XXL2_9ACTN